MLKRISIIVIGIFVWVPLVGFYLLNFGNPIHKFVANRYVPEYLKKQVYEDDDISESHYVEPKHRVNKDYYHGHYTVVFKDEPYMYYYYGVSKKSKEVVQFCERDWQGATDGNIIDFYEKNNTSKHLEEDCVNLLDNRD